LSSIEKLEEAKFFLELLDSLNHRVESLTKIEDKAKEASYLFSATLNSFYSVIAIMRDSEGVSVSSFTKNYPEIYARAKNGGERAKTVHVNHTNTAHSGYIPPSANEVNFYFRDLPKLADPNKNVGNSRASCKTPNNVSGDLPLT